MLSGTPQASNALAHSGERGDRQALGGLSRAHSEGPFWHRGQLAPLGAIFEPLGAQGAKEALLVAWGVGDEGRKHLLHLLVGNKEPEAAWAELLANLLSRGMRAPATATSDGAPGLVKAIEAVFPQSTRARCWAHRLANVRPKLADEVAGEVMAHVYAVRDAPTLDAARAAADRFARLYANEYPSAVACSQDDPEALLGPAQGARAPQGGGAHDELGGALF
jgi:hypothetical protein